jgi:Tfp pilus assembly protein PilF
VSLLMDALRRAELAKKQGQADAASDMALEPVAAPAGDGAHETLPELPKLEDLDDEFIEHANKQSARPAKAAEHGARPASGSAEDRASVRNAFAVKGGIADDRKVMVMLAAAGLLVLGGMGAWFWLQFRPVPGQSARPVQGVQASVSRQEVAPPPAAPIDAARSTTMPLPPATPEIDEDEEPAPARRAAIPVTRTPAPLPASDTRIRVTTNATTIDPGVAEGYRLLQAGNLSGAKSAYTEALRNDPRNADALHGLATVALQQGRTDDAAGAYLRILEANPADPAAQAGLIGLNGQGDPVAGESRIKSLISTQGELPVLSFALGNLYARQERWNDAQQAYFKAVTGDAGNPDYLFNLGVSLDQIHQPKLAADYYRQALKAAETRQSAFSRAQVETRLREIQP